MEEEKWNKKILKLKKQNEIKVEDIICNIYNFFIKILFMYLSILLLLKIKIIWEKKNDIKQSLIIPFLARLIQTPRQYDCHALNDCLIHVQSPTTQQSEQIIL